MTEPRLPDSEAAPPTAPAELPASEVEEFVSTLGKSLRARQMYQSNNPVYQRFIVSLAAAVQAVWQRTPSLQLTVDEKAFRWEGKTFTGGEGRENLAFLFYKDGIRYLTFLPGFEEEVERFLDVVHRARVHDQESDDLITLLWQEEFAGFQYGYVDQLAEGVSLPKGGGAAPDPLELGDVVKEVSGDREPVALAQDAGTAAETVSRDDFDETVFLLEDDEMRRVQDEIEREWRRDLKAEVLNALFDRLEDPEPERQDEILRILRQLLPIFLGGGDLVSASTILLELQVIRNQGDVLADEQQATVERIFHELSEPVLLEQVIGSLEEGTIEPGAAELGVFLRHLRPDSMPFLIRVTETTSAPAVRDRLRMAIEGIAREHSAVLLDLLESKEAVVAAGAARVVGRLKLSRAEARLSKLLKRSEAEVRLAAVEALAALRSSDALDALGRALGDSDRDVRIAAARGLGALRFQPATARLKAVLEGRRMKDADVTEKIAFFEAYGAVGGAESVKLLDQYLNGKKRFGRRPASEIRACAALALGKVTAPGARTALEQAERDPDPVVRSAVVRALRREPAAS